MKIQLDTNQKVIKLEDSVNLGDLQELLEKILPNGEWKEYKLDPCVIKNWSNPIIIDRFRPIPYPWWSITQGALSQTNTVSTGVYNLSSIRL